MRIKAPVITYLPLLFSLSLFSQGADIFDPEIVTIDIMFKNQAWHDTLAARKLRGDKTPLIASIRIGEKGYSNIEVRYKGNSSFHGTLKYGGDKLPFRLKAGKGLTFEGGYDKLRLSNNFRDPSAIRELLAYRIASDYVPVPKVAPAVVTINDQYVGVYTLTEGISDRMLEEYYCNTEGTLVKCEPDFHGLSSSGCSGQDYANLAYLGDDNRCYEYLYDVAKSEEKETIIALTRQLRYAKDPERFLNIHQTLWMHALNNVLVNLDSYLGIFCHNYYIYKDENGYHHPLIWDLNLAFGGFATLTQKHTPDPYTLSPIVHDRYLQDKRPLIESLTTNRTYRRTYFNMITTITEDWFASRKYIREARRMQALVRPYVEKENKAAFTVSEFDNSLSETIKKGNNRSIPGIAQLMEERTDYLLQHTLLAHQPPVLISNGTEDSYISLSTSRDVKNLYSLLPNITV